MPNVLHADSTDEDVRRVMWDVMSTSEDALRYLNDCVLGDEEPNWAIVAAALASMAALNAIHVRWVADHAAPGPMDRAAN